MTSSNSNNHRSNLRKAWEYIVDFVKDVIDLKKGVDPLRTIDETRSKLSITGANAWMLMCSIIIASIGLSQNSQAVIIGAMLISPLMAPMLGIGLSVGINDMNTLRQSLIHFLIAIVIAVLTSTVYFYLSPIDTVTPEIDARTRPTFLDIFVAIFGGTAGIISIARKDISTTLPGVAIATALMPPLCVTGFGIAHHAWEIALRSFYLFFLNSFFVVLATYIIIRYLKFPYKKYLDRSVWLKNVLYIGLFSLAMVVPSFLIFRGVIRDLNIRVSCEKFVETCLGEDNIYLDSYVFEEDDRILYLKVYGDVIHNGEYNTYATCLEDVGLEDVTLEIISTSDVNLDRVQVIEQDIRRLAKQVKAAEALKAESEVQLAVLSRQYIDTSFFDQLSKELAVLFPNLEEVGLAKMHLSDLKAKRLNEAVIVVKWKEPAPETRSEDNETIRRFVAQKIPEKAVRIIEYQ